MFDHVRKLRMKNIYMISDFCIFKFLLGDQV